MDPTVTTTERPFVVVRAPSRRVKTWIFTGIVAVVLVLLACAVPYSHARVRTEIIRRCVERTQFACALEGLSLSRHGALLQGLSLRGMDGTVTVNIAEIDLRFSWVSALTRREPLSLVVVVSTVRVRSDATVDRALDHVQMLRTRRANARGNSRSGMTLASVVVDDVRASMAVLPGVVGTLEGASLRWSPREGLEPQWRNASVRVGDVGEMATGRCTVELRDEQGFLRCVGFGLTGDLATVAERAVELKAHALRWQSRARGLAETRQAGTASDTPRALDVSRPWPTRWQLEGREGEVTLRRGHTLIAQLRPASVALTRTEHGFDRAEVRLGESQRTAIETTLQRLGGDRWTLDVRGESLPLAELARWVTIVPWHATERGSVHVQGTVRPTAEGLEAQGDLRISGFSLEHRRLASAPVEGLSVRLRGSVIANFARHRLETREMELSLNEVPLRFRGWIERTRERTAMDVSVAMPVTSCDGIRAALPESLTGAIHGLSFAGTLGGQARLALDTELLDDTLLEVHVDDHCVVSRSARGTLTDRFRTPFVQRVREPNQMRAFVTGPGSGAWVALPEISQHLVQAILSREDGRFYRHDGIDVHEIRHAIVRNVAAGRFVYGASTISMQLAKNVFLAREKTLVRKLQELVLTWYLERTLGKDGILELYLNVIELGPGVYGVGPAARHYFNVEPSMLTPLQAIFLATLLPNPVVRSQPFHRGSVGPGTLAMLRAHARIMFARGLLTAEELAVTQSAELTFRPRRAVVYGAGTQEIDPTEDEPLAIARVLALPVVPRPLEPLVPDAASAPNAIAGANPRTHATLPEGEESAVDESTEEALDRGAVTPASLTEPDRRPVVRIR